MKEITTYNRATQYLNKVFKLVNDEYFSGTLEMPTITIQSTIGAYGHVTSSKVWKNENGESTYELNIGADYLYRPIEKIVATVIHECCHLYAMQNGIKDTSNRGVYHNRKFKKLAEERGLVISKDAYRGWTVTEPSVEIYEFCEKWELKKVLISRDTGRSNHMGGNGNEDHGDRDAPVAGKSTSIKWICPKCGAIARTTKDTYIICGYCKEKYIRA